MLGRGCKNESGTKVTWWDCEGYHIWCTELKEKYQDFGAFFVF